MVWSRNKLLIWDYIFEPVKEITFSYSGKNPEKYYKKIHELIRLVFNVPDVYVQEKTYSWERGQGGEKFEVDLEVNKILDKFTYLTVELEFKGSSANGEGKVSIRMKPRMITEYPQDTIWQQNILYEFVRRLWHKFYYHEQRMKYLRDSKEFVITFDRELKAFGESLNL